MPDAVILTAGKATRAGSHAPEGCKALVPLDDRPIIEWQQDALDADLTIVCRSEHARLLDGYGEVIVNDRCAGAADALASALPHVRGPFTVAYADTYFTDLPAGTDWVGTWTALGGRSWYVIRDGFVAYEHVPEGWTAKVGVGLFSFSDPDRLAFQIDRLSHKALHLREMGLDIPLNSYGPWREVDVPSWRDVGDDAAIEAWAS